MDSDIEIAALQAEHTKEAIAARLSAATQHSYLGDFVLGAVDGAVTTFAIVSGVAGAGLSTGVAVVLGIANVLADGFSMAVGNFLSTKSQHEFLDYARRTEERHIQEHPEGEREEIRQIFKAKGFEGELLETITQTITERRQRWVDTMLTEELGLQLEPPQPLKASLTTFGSFLLAGMMPVLPLFLAPVLSANQTFAASAIATAVTFCGIGAVKARVTNKNILNSVVEILLIGGCASILAYAAGAGLKGLVGG